MNQKIRVLVQWTKTAKEALSKLPPKVIKGLLGKADDLRKGDDPRKVNKPLVGPLKGHFRITYGRYRAVYTCQEETLANGDVVIQITVLFVAAGIRKEGDRNDIYKFARKLVDLGVLTVKPAKDKPKKKE